MSFARLHLAFPVKAVKQCGMRISVMDMFCGAGGSSAGARLTGADVIHGIDAWALAAHTFRDNFEGATVDIRDIASHPVRFAVAISICYLRLLSAPITAPRKDRSPVARTVDVPPTMS